MIEKENAKNSGETEENRGPWGKKVEFCREGEG